MCSEAYPPPRCMRRKDRSAQFAYVTLFMLNDSYLPGVVMLAYALRQQRTNADLVCLVSSEISEQSRRVLWHFYDRVIEVKKIHIPYGRSQKRQHTPFVLTRLHALRLGPDGDLGCRYKKSLCWTPICCPFNTTTTCSPFPHRQG